MKKYFIILLIILLFGCSNSNKTILIAHRGAKNYAPEHTIPAYEKAVKMGADYIEIDLRMTKDGQLVALHDETVDRTTNGHGDILTYTLNDLKKLDAGSWFGHKYRDVRIPTLEEIIKHFGRNTNYYIETRLVKNKPLMEKKLLRILKENDVLDKVIIESFSQESLKKIHKMDSRIPLILLVLNKDISQINVEDVRKYAVGIGPYAPQINKKFVEKMHKSGLQVHVWFDQSNEKEYIKNVLKYGVDGVFTDYLDNTKVVEKRIDN